MKNKDNINEIINFLQSEGTGVITTDEAAIEKAYTSLHGEQTLVIKVISILGGIFASSVFFGFMFIAGLYESPTALWLTGFVAIGASVLLSRISDRILLDTICISCFIVGLVMVGAGLSDSTPSAQILSLYFVVISCACLLLSQNYVLSFASTLVVNGSLICLIQSSKLHELLHVHIACLALLLCYLILQEAKVLSSGKAIAAKYGPIRTGLLFSFVSSLLLVNTNFFVQLAPETRWISTALCIVLLCYVVTRLFNTLSISSLPSKLLILALVALTLAPTALTPGIAATLLLLMLSFAAHYKTGMVVSAMAFIYFAGLFYYDLNFTLLTKSIMLFCSGLFFIVLYLLTTKKANNHENI